MNRNKQHKKEKNELKLRCDTSFQHAFTTFSFVFKVITLVWANQCNFFENATTCSKHMRETLVATQLYLSKNKSLYVRVKQVYYLFQKVYDWIDFYCLLFITRLSDIWALLFGFRPDKAFINDHR